MSVDAALTAALAWARWRGRMLDVTSRGCLLSEKLLALAARARLHNPAAVREAALSMARTDCFPTQMNHLFLVSPPSGLETDSVLDSLANLGMGVWCKDQDKWFPRFSPHQLPYWFWVPNGLSKSAPLPMPMCSEPFLARTHGVICALQLTIDSLTSKKSELQAKRDQIAILRVCAFYICIFYFFLFFLFLLFFFLLSFLM